MIKDKVVIVTGGAGLIGSEFVKCIADAGGIPIIADLTPNCNKTLDDYLECSVGEKRYMSVQVDINSSESVSNLIERVTNRFGQIDALVNNAYPKNKNYGRPFFEVSHADFCENLSLNIGGYFLTSQLIAKHFRNNGNGNIINVASIYGIVAPRFDIYDNVDMTMPVEYAAIKSAIIHITKYMAKYLKGSNVRVNSISPGGVYNNHSELFAKSYNSHCLSKGMLASSDLNGTLIFLLSDMSKFINGQNIVVDDGFTL